MNYYMPFNNYVPKASTGLLSKIFKGGINFSTILTNTQKTLNIINQAIPVIKQAGPVMNNAKTIFKIMNEFKKVDIPIKKNKVNNDISTNKEVVKIERHNSNNPIFFV